MYAIRSYYVLGFNAALAGFQAAGVHQRLHNPPGKVPDDTVAFKKPVFAIRIPAVTARITSYNVCYTKLLRNFAHFMRGFAVRNDQELEFKEFTRLRTIVAAPVGALIYAYAFYVPEGPPSRIYFWISWLGNLPLRSLFFIEIIFLIINFRNNFV